MILRFLPGTALLASDAKKQPRIQYKQFMFYYGQVMEIKYPEYFSKYEIHPNIKVLYEADGWCIIVDLNTNLFVVAHYCSTGFPNTPLWHHSSWIQFSDLGAVCYCCRRKIPDHIQTIYILVSK